MADLIDRDEVKRELNAQYAAAKNTANPDAVEQVLRAVSKFFDSFPAVNRWIPCSERLPENFVWCLVCMSDRCIRIGKWNGEYDEQGVWWVSHPNSGGKLYRIKNVPFWMPYPEPPEKE